MLLLLLTYILYKFTQIQELILTYIKRIHNRIHKHMTSILKYAVLVLSLSLTATLHAKSINDSSQTQQLSKAQIECLVRLHIMKAKLDKGMNMMYYLILIED